MRRRLSRGFRGRPRRVVGQILTALPSPARMHGTSGPRLRMTSGAGIAVGVREGGLRAVV